MAEQKITVRALTDLEEISIPNDKNIKTISTPLGSPTDTAPSTSIQAQNSNVLMDCTLNFNTYQRDEIATTVRDQRNSIQAITAQRYHNNNHYLQDKFMVLVKALKGEYSKCYRGVKTLPFLIDSWQCVNDIFVESRICYLDKTKLPDDPNRLQAIKSRHEVFSEMSHGMHITVEGDPGFGKSTLLLQYAYDWSTSAIESPLKDVDILVLLHLKDLKGVQVIYDAIKMMLPEDVNLSTEDIKNIITSGQWKVMFALDGFDEYPEARAWNSDIHKIVHGRILTFCFVIITTRPSCLPNLLSPKVKHFRLAGFDQRIQEMYIRKVITSNSANKRMKDIILRKLNENDFLSDICQVPLFFVVFAHMTCRQPNNEEFSTVTGYFSFILTCFLSHFQNKGNVVGESDTSALEQPFRLQLAKFAFLGLNDKKQELVWTKEYTLTKIGESCCAYYVAAGILLEEQTTTLKMERGSYLKNKVSRAHHIRFFHKTFQEFYAAVYISQLVEFRGFQFVRRILSNFNFNDLQYLFRFACGLTPATARVVGEYMSSLGEDGRIFSILCLKEQSEQDIDKSLTHLCSGRIELGIRESKLLQRSKIQLLQTASQRKIAISSVRIRWGNLRSVDLYKESLCLLNGLHLPKLDTLRELEIHGIIDLRDTARDILDFSARNAALKTLKFTSVFLFGVISLPRMFDNQEVLRALHRKGCRVQWEYFVVFDFIWELNLQSGRWEGSSDGHEMTDDEYREVVARHENFYAKYK